MKIRYIYFLTLISCTAFGQKTDISDKKTREHIAMEYLSAQYKIIKVKADEIERDLLAIPYSVGDTFELNSTLHIWNHFEDSVIILDTDENSYVPKDYNVKLIKLEGGYYFVEANNKAKTDQRSGYISVSHLTDYFFPENKGRMAELYSEYIFKDDKLRDELTKKYNLSRRDIDGIIDEIVYQRRR